MIDFVIYLGTYKCAEAAESERESMNQMIGASGPQRGGEAAHRHKNDSTTNNEKKAERKKIRAIDVRFALPDWMLLEPDTRLRPMRLLD